MRVSDPKTETAAASPHAPLPYASAAAGAAAGAAGASAGAASASSRAQASAAGPSFVGGMRFLGWGAQQGGGGGGGGGGGVRLGSGGAQTREYGKEAGGSGGGAERVKILGVGECVAFGSRLIHDVRFSVCGLGCRN